MLYYSHLLMCTRRILCPFDGGINLCRIPPEVRRCCFRRRASLARPLQDGSVWYLREVLWSHPWNVSIVSYFRNGSIGIVVLLCSVFRHIQSRRDACVAQAEGRGIPHIGRRLRPLTTTLFFLDILP